MVRKNKTKDLPLVIQEGALKSYFPDSKILREGEIEIKWEHTVRPSPLSAQYKLLLHYNKGVGAKIYVLDPKPLALAMGKKALPHVYSTEEQQLCLFYPKLKEWTPSLLYVKTLIPWACEWLLHYEIWAATGYWRGGGIEHSTETGKDNEQSKSE